MQPGLFFMQAELRELTSRALMIRWKSSMNSELFGLRAEFFCPTIYR